MPIIVSCSARNLCADTTRVGAGAALVVLGVVMLMLWGETTAQAQVLPPIFDPTGRSSEPPAPLKKEFKPPAPPPSPVLPSVPLPPEEQGTQPLGQVQVLVRDIFVTGSTVFSEAELSEVTAPFKNRILTTEDL